MHNNFQPPQHSHHKNDNEAFTNYFLSDSQFSSDWEEQDQYRVDNHPDKHSQDYPQNPSPGFNNIYNGRFEDKYDNLSDIEQGFPYASYTSISEKDDHNWYKEDEDRMAQSHLYIQMEIALRALCPNQVRWMHAVAGITGNSAPLDHNESDPSRNAATT